MSDSDPDYIPTAWQLDHDDFDFDQYFDDFDPDIDDLSLCEYLTTWVLFCNN